MLKETTAYYPVSGSHLSLGRGAIYPLPLYINKIQTYDPTEVEASNCKLKRAEAIY